MLTCRCTHVLCFALKWSVGSFSGDSFVSVTLTLHRQHKKNFFNWVRVEDHTLDKLHVKEYVIVILLVSRLPDHPSALVLHGHHRLVQFSSRGRAGEWERGREQQWLWPGLCQSRPVWHGPELWRCAVHAFLWWVMSIVCEQWMNIQIINSWFWRKGSEKKQARFCCRCL